MLQWVHRDLNEDNMKYVSIEGDKYLLDQYEKELEKEKVQLSENEQKKKSYQKQVKIMGKAQAFSVVGIFGSLIAVVFLLTSSQIVIPILSALGFVVGTILTSVEKYNDQQIISLVDTHTNEIQTRIDTLEVELKKLQSKINKQSKESNKQNKIEKVQTFLLYTPKNQQFVTKENDEQIDEEVTCEETFVS